MNNVSVFILAGGRSSRMGRDKALLELEGTSLVERAVLTARLASESVFIVGEGRKYSRFGDVVEDVYPECGPLGGIHAALKSSGSDYNMVLAVDMPFLTSTLLKFIAERAAESKADVTAPKIEDRMQPLCAVYRKSFLTISEDALKKERYKITSLFTRVKTHVIEEKELAAAGFAPDLFRNWNSPADMKSEVSLG